VRFGALQGLRVLDDAPTVDPAVDQIGHQPQHDTDAEQNAGDAVLLRVPASPWTDEEAQKRAPSTGTPVGAMKCRWRG